MQHHLLIQILSRPLPFISLRIVWYGILTSTFLTIFLDGQQLSLSLILISNKALHSFKRHVVLEGLQQNAVPVPPLLTQTQFLGQLLLHV